jgi:sugar lactone lactonase YvrE
MNAKVLNALFIVFELSLGWSVAWSAQSEPPYPTNATFTTRATTPFAIEGLTMDATGNFYTTGRQPDTTKKCPVWRIRPSGSRVSVGFIPNSPACNPSGIAFDSIGNLYIADAATGGKIWKVAPDASGCASDDSNSSICTSIASSPTHSPTTAFASGVPGTNGLAFDKSGNLWTGDGTTGQGRVWKITSPGANCTASPPVNCEEVFRIQPMANEVNLVDGVGGVGRDVRTLPPGTITVTATTRNAANQLGSQPLVANGLAFNTAGDLFVADTARGALWQVKFNTDGTLKSHLGCDETFHPNTLCLNHIFVADPRLEGVDGIALDINGNIWASVNERNAIAIFGTGVSAEVFRNPVNTNPRDPNFGLRNSSATDNGRILELPTSPFLLGNLFCTANSDGNRRDNSPNTAGEIGGTGAPKGKISCMDQPLTYPGLPLPIQ